MPKFWGSVTFRITLLYAALAVGSLAVISAVFYYGTVVEESQDIDMQLQASSRSLSANYTDYGLDDLEREIGQLLDDGINQDDEVYVLLDPKGGMLTGNLDAWPKDPPPFDTVVTQVVSRYGRRSESRMIWHQLPDGSLLAVGRDMGDQLYIRWLVWHSLAVAAAASLLLALLGAFFFQRRIARNVAVIRRTAQDIQAGDLSKRIPLAPTEDEFARLSRDINRMLDRIEQLMDGVRHVSNTIAHNLRTPLGRTRAQLEAALRHHRDATPMSEAAAAAIQEIDDLILVFERLLQIAESESGTRRQPFESVDLAALVTDVVELYDATAESRGMALITEVTGKPQVLGDRHLLASALANLIENAIKYADGSPAVRVAVEEGRDHVALVVTDKGPGVPADALGRITERFYRLESDVPGSGLGLSIVTAIAYLHQGSLQLEDARPGLRASILIPREHAAAHEPITLPRPRRSA